MTLHAAVTESVACAAVRPGVSVHFDAAIDQIHDPVLGNAESGVQTPLGVAVVAQRAVRDLDDQQGGSGVVVTIVSNCPTDNRDIGLGFGGGPESERELHADVEPWSNDGTQRFVRPGYCDYMRGA